MRRFALLLLMMLLLMAAPVHAQVSTPTPAPAAPSSPELQALQALAHTMQDLSANNASTANAGVLMLGAAFFLLTAALLVVVVWVARGGLTPLFETIRSERAGRQQAEDSETHTRTRSDQRESEAAELRKEQAHSLERTAGALERTTTLLDSLETKQAAADGRHTTVEAVNQHTTEDGDKTREQLQAVVVAVVEARQTAAKAATIEDLNKVLKPVLDKFDELSTVVREAIRQADSQTLPVLKPIVVPGSDPSTPQ